MRKLQNKELNRLDIEEFKKKKKIPVSIILDNIRSMHNVGSVFRTSDAFCIEKIFLCGITARPPHRDINKTALGATESVTWEYCENITTLLKRLKQSHTLIGFEQTDSSISLLHFRPQVDIAYAFVFGNEVFGVDTQVLQQCHLGVEIPQFGTKHSFNIAISVGIVLWDYFVKTK